jgi:hypothetical protein
MWHGKGFLLVLAFAALCFAPKTSAEEIHTCFSAAGPAGSGEMAGFKWEIKPIKDKFDDCRGRLWSPSKHLVFSTIDHNVSLDSVSGQDVNGNGKHDLVFIGYSGGAHCCWTYWIISLGERPGLIAKIYNQRGVSFEPTGPNNSIEMWALDGSFDYFDGFRFSHAETVFPTVVLRLEGKTIRDVSAEHRDEYDSQIVRAREKLPPEAVQRWKPTDAASPEICEYEDKILTIVFAYLYSGRPDAAWQALADYWPPGDAQRIKEVIMKDRKAGVLRYVR